MTLLLAINFWLLADKIQGNDSLRFYLSMIGLVLYIIYYWDYDRLKRKVKELEKKSGV